MFKFLKFVMEDDRYFENR